MKKIYEKPQLTVVSFNVEQGFALSNPSSKMLGFNPLDFDYADKSVEDRTDGGHWGNGDGWF